MPLKAELLTVIGAANWDLTAFVERLPDQGEEARVLAVEEYPGGKGANTAVAAARILGQGKVAFVGCVGDDHPGKMQRSSLEQAGVSTLGLVTSRGTESGRAFVTVDPHGRKRIHTYFGANGELTPGILSVEGPSSVLRRTRTLVVMDAPLETAKAAIAACPRAEVVYSPGVYSSSGREVDSILADSDHLVLNESELKALARKRTLLGCCRSVSSAHFGLDLIVTLGEDGCELYSGGKSKRFHGFDLRRYGSKALNATGSGDAFLGALAAYRTLGFGIGRCATMGNVAGALKATRRETRGSPDKDTLEKAAAQIDATGLAEV